MNIVNYKIVRFCAIFITLFLLVYLFPIIQELPTLNIQQFINDQDGINEAWYRSALFTLLTTVFNIFVSIIIAIGLRKISLFSMKGKYLSFLLVPVLIGNVSIAFIGKLLFANNSVLHQSVLIKFLTLLGIQFWQFGTMYIYLFWLVIQNIPKNTWSYVEAAQLNLSEQIRDIMLPACRNLAILLFIINFIFSWYEDAKIEFIFKASRGTNTELVTQWLNRTYQSTSLLSPNIAIKQNLQISIIILGIALTFIVLGTFIFYNFYGNLIKNRLSFPIISFTSLPQVYWFGLLLLVLIPIFYVILYTPFSLNVNLLHLSTPLIFTGVTAFLAILIAIFLGIFWRIGWRNTLSSFNRQSIWFFIFLFILQLIPPTALLIIGFKWLKVVGYQTDWYIFIAWIIGHIFLILPLLCSFVILVL